MRLKHCKTQGTGPGNERYGTKGDGVGGKTQGTGPGNERYGTKGGGVEENMLKVIRNQSKYLDAKMHPRNGPKTSKNEPKTSKNEAKNGQKSIKIDQKWIRIVD